MEKPKGIILKGSAQNKDIYLVYPANSAEEDLSNVEAIAVIGLAEAMIKEDIVSYIGEGAPDNNKWLIAYRDEKLGTYEDDNFEDAKERLNYQIGTLGYGIGGRDMEAILSDLLSDITDITAGDNLN